MNKILDALFKVIEVMIAVFLAMMIALVFLNVVGRYVFNVGFVWSEEISRLCFIFLVYLGSIEAMRGNRHLLIDALLIKTPKAVGKALYALIQVCIIWLMAILVRGSWGLVIQNRNNRWVTTGFPAHVVHFFGIILGVSIALIAAYNLVRLFILKIPVEDMVAIRDEEANEGDITSIE
ncbi:MAG: TRAP transporter small permease [Spirochaetaceae bacterium]|jgi:TRAP-type C4-dicarboxylate transport system permease small subunit|nr:TRAP transporter small permease [Spirochaetaceae bacterium]